MPRCSLALAGFAAMYVPVYWWAATAIWQSDEQAHGALDPAVMLWLFWGLRKPIAELEPRPAPGWGWPLFVFGLLVYLVGRVLQISILEFGSQPFVVAGILLLLRGRAAIRIAWFPLFYFIFMIPLPGIIVDAVTGPLKQWISVIVVELLYSRGLPDRAQRRHPRHRPVPDARRRRLLGPAFDVQPVGARNALHVHHGAAKPAAQRDHAGEHPADRLCREHRAGHRAGADHLSLRR